MNERIALAPEIQQGKPVIRGTRIPVATILNGLAGGMSVRDVVREYEIEPADVEAALAYAAEIIDAERAIAPK